MFGSSLVSWAINIFFLKECQIKEVLQTGAPALVPSPSPAPCLIPQPPDVSAGDCVHVLSVAAAFSQYGVGHLLGGWQTKPSLGVDNEIKHVCSGQGKGPQFQKGFPTLRKPFP